jgi:uncharacterized protein (TIGR02594 family)
MQSNFERWTAVALVAGAVAFVGTTSSAEAHRHRTAHAFASETRLHTARWHDAREGHAIYRLARLSRQHHRGEAWSGEQSWSNQSWSNGEQSHQEMSSNDSWGREESWGPQRVGVEPKLRNARRGTRVASLGKASFGASSGSGSDLVSEARRWIGTNPTGWAHVWCGRFMNFVLERTGRRGTGSNLALSFAHYGSRVGGPQVGAIAVMGRRGRAAGGSAGGHVGVVSGIDANGNPIIISGNHGHIVAEAVYPRSRIFAYVMP